MAKTIYIFDLDHTLVHTTAQVRVVMDGQVVLRLPSGFNAFNELEMVNGSIDYSEFGDLERLVSDEKLPLYKQFTDLIYANKEVHILTARTNKVLIQGWLEANGLKIPKERIHTNSYHNPNAPKHKAYTINKIIRSQEDQELAIWFFDDYEKNRQAVGQEAVDVCKRLNKTLDLQLVDPANY